MNEQLTLQSTQHEETKTVPLRRRKACLAGTFALFAACALVLLIPHPAYAGIIGDFLDIPNMIKTWLLQIAATLFNTYFGVINQTLDAKFISGPFNELFGTTEPYGVVKDFYQAGVIPVAHAILGLFMLMQLIKISQRIDATSTLPAVKDIVFLVVTYCILSYFIDNALDLVSAIYGIFNDLVGNVSDKGDTGKSRDDDCNGFPYLPAPAAKKSREGHPKIDDSHDGECARSGSYRRGGEFDECFQVPSSIRPLSAFFAWHFS